MNIFGIQVDKKTDVLALSAFLLSVAGIISQLLILSVVTLRGTAVSLFNPDQVLFKADAFEKDGERYLRIGARMAYTNSGATGYTAVIKRETVTMDFGSGFAVRQQWQSFETFDIVDQKLTSIERKPANPMPIEAGSAESHDTYFVPFREWCDQGAKECDEWRNYLSWSGFLDKTKNTEQLVLKFAGEVYGDEPVHASCTVRVDRNFTERVTKNGWYAPSCREKRDQ